MYSGMIKGRRREGEGKEKGETVFAIHKTAAFWIYVIISIIMKMILINLSFLASELDGFV